MTIPGRAGGCERDSVVIGTKQIKCQPFKRWLSSRGSVQANSFGKQSAAILFSPTTAVLTFAAWITLMDSLESSPVVAPRSKVRLQVDIYNKLNVKGSVQPNENKKVSLTTSGISLVVDSWGFIFPGFGISETNH